MCGRFFLSRSGAEIARAFGLSEEPVLAPRFNVAPSQPVPIVRARVEDGGRRVLEPMQWGFVPRFAKSRREGNRPINARAETIATTPLFRSAFARRRGIVPADGFYEWQHRGRSSRPFAVRLRDGSLLAMAAVFERFEDEEGALDSCAIVTTEANEAIAAIHGRMPALLAPHAIDAWLDPALSDADSLLPLLRPCPAAWIEAYPVDRRVNDVHEDDARLPEPERDLFSLGSGA